MMRDEIFGILMALALAVGVGIVMAGRSQAQGSGVVLGTGSQLDLGAGTLVGLATPVPPHTVNSNGDASDANPGDGVCETAPGNGACTLRAAIEETNALTGTDTIFFDDSIGLIMPGSPLPTLDDTSGGTTIKGNPTWILGSTAGASAPGFDLDSDGNKLQGLLITNFGGDGVMIRSDNNNNNNIIGVDGDGVDDDSEGNVISSNGGHGVHMFYNATGNWLAGNLIGLTIDGTDDDGNAESGVQIRFGAHTNRIGANGDGVSDKLERNVISGNDEYGVAIMDANVGYNVVAGNYIGTNAAGDAAVPNTGPGVRIALGSDHNRVGTDGDGLADDLEGNVISGNGGHGVSLFESDNNVIAGNYIGVNAAGNAAIPNSGSGVHLHTGTDNLIGTDGDGTADELEHNLISGNGETGVTLNATTTGTVVAGNYIGVNAAGDAAIANLDEGVSINNDSTNNLIGTDADGASDELERNVISGNGQNGVRISSGSDENIVAGNYIGANAAGDAAIPNGDNGVYVSFCANNRIGGTVAAERNLISGNSSMGVYLFASTTIQVQGNYVGTDASGSGNLGNGVHGVIMFSDAISNTVGGTTAGAANRIAFNSQAGIRVHKATDTDSYDNPLRGNAIFANGELGIDLVPGEGVTPNDSGDGDSGANNLQNYPVLSSAGSDDSQIFIKGSLDSSGNTTFALDFYANSSCDPSGYGEGELYLGADTVTTDGSGDASFTATLLSAVPVGYYATATATDLDGNTSEFSQCLAITDHCFPVHDADFDWAPTTSIVSQVVTLTGSASGTLPITFTWDFGDGSAATGATVDHTYAVTGAYVVTLTTGNACGTDESVRTLVVEGASPEGYSIYLPILLRK